MKNKLSLFISVLTLVAIWFIVSQLVENKHLAPSPIETLNSLLALFSSAGFLKAVFFTLTRAFTGFFLALSLGVVIGLLSSEFSIIKHFFYPVITIIRSTPVISFILLALVWFKTENVAIFIGFLMMYPFIHTSIIEGIKNIDPELLQMARLYRIPKLKMVKDIYFPAILPFIFNGISHALGFGWKAVIIGEALSQPQYGIGTELQNAQSFLLVPKVLAWTIVALAVSYLFELTLKILERKVTQWKRA